MKQAWISAVVLLAAASTGTCAFAGPDYDEGNKDAGATPATARTVSSGSGGPITKISGGTSTALVGGADNVDLYEIEFDPQATSWTIMCEPGWDVQLFLFRKYNDSVTHLLAAADDISDTNNGAKLDNGMVTVDKAYRHYLAVTGPGMKPGEVGAQGLFIPCFPSGIPTNWTGVIVPQNPRFNDWNGTASAAGAYNNALLGLTMILSDTCADAAVLAAGQNAIDNREATTDPLPYDSASCSFDGVSGLGNDVWFVYDPECAGIATVKTCGTINFDSTIVVYEVEPGGACPVDPTPHACNDDGEGCAGFSSLVDFAVDTCHTYYVRVGGYCSGEDSNGLCAIGSHGYGNVTLAPPNCTPSCPETADINGDGVVNGADLTILLTRWGTDGTGAGG